MPHSANENTLVPLPPSDEPDAHGQAALILIESILHALVEKDVLTTHEALDAIHTAHEVKTEIATRAHESESRMQESLELLKRIAMTFEVDLR